MALHYGNSVLSGPYGQSLVYYPQASKYFSQWPQEDDILSFFQQINNDITHQSMNDHNRINFYIYFQQIYQCMNHHQAQESREMNKTQINMYNTLDPLSKTARKGQKNLMNLTSRTRYSKKAPYNPQTTLIASSISKQHKLKANLNLPDIKKQKKLMIEQWLNDSLQGHEKETSGKIKQPLKTLKKLQMDRRSLVNSNLSHDQIEHMYNSLYVFTTGIKSAFEQMFAYAANSNRGANKFQKTYWRMFMNLLQHATPVKLCFQIVQEDYVKESLDLKRCLAKITEQKEEDERQLHEKALKLQKEIEEYERKSAESIKEYNLLKSNVDLYEQMFNEEVSLRLKFQQKINLTYTSYEELKFKYQDIKTDLNHKNLMVAELNNDKYVLQHKLNNTQIQYEAIQKKAQEMETLIKQREKELTIKNQQINDIFVQNNADQQRNIAEQAALQELLIKIKNLHKNETYLKIKIQEKDKIIAEKNVLIQKVKVNLTDSRQKNDEMYLKYHEKSMENLKLSEESLKIQVSLDETKRKINNLEIHIKQTQDQLASNKNLLNLSQQELKQTKCQVATKGRTLQIFSNNISQMKAVKDKYERINKTLELEKKSLLAELTEVIQRTKLFQNEKQELLDQIPQFKKEIQRLEIEIVQHKENNQRILKQNRKDIKTCDQKVKELNVIIKIRQKEISCLKQTNTKLITQIDRRDAQKIKTLQEILFLKQENTFLHHELKEKVTIINNLSQQLQESTQRCKNTSLQLQSKEFTINKKRKQIDNEIINLRINLNQYKGKVYILQQYIHPMIVQDQRQRIVDLNQRIIDINEKNLYISQNYEILMESMASKDDQIKKRDQIIMTKDKNIQSEQLKTTKKQDEIKLVKLSYDSKLKQKEQTFEKIKANYLDKQLEYLDIIYGNKLKIEEYQITVRTINKELQEQKDISKKNSQKLDQKMKVNRKEKHYQSKETQTQITTNIQSNKDLDQSHEEKNKPNERAITNKSNENKGKAKGQIKYLQLEPKTEIIQVKLQIKNKKSHENNLIFDESEQQHQEHHDNHNGEGRHDKKVEGKQFKVALRLSYIRK